MLRIMLVEDEPPILRELIGTIRSFGEDFSIVATATNGDAALDELKRIKGLTDILITDLRIPGVDGLTLIETVRRAYPEMVCAILTGYSEFAYAQKAIGLQVADYLLKPVNEDALRALLERCLQRKWFGNATPRGTLHPGESGVPLYAATICIGAYPYYSTLENILPAELWHFFPLDDLPGTDDILSGLLIEDGFASTVKSAIFSLKPGKSTKDAENLFTPLLRGPVPLNIAICEGSGGMEGVRRAMQTTRRYLCQNIVFGKSGVFLCRDEPAAASKRPPAPAGEIEALATLFADGKRAVFQSECARLLYNMRQSGTTQQQAVLALNQLYDACVAQAGSEPISRMTSGEIINEAFMLSDGYDNLYENIMSIFSEFQDDRVAGSPAFGDRSNILVQVDAYIQNRYRQPLSTAKLAKEFGFTPAYLSKIFREYRHMSPLEYIVQLRIEKAKRLFLDSPALSVREVADSVGYEDSLYFSKVFKKAVGVSPKQYAETQGRALSMDLTMQ